MSVSKRSIPFQDLGMREKQNLALAALFFFYMILFGWQIATSKLVFGYGADFLAFWSGGYIANTHEYEQVYDIGILDQVQRSLINVEGQFSPLPVALFPIFVAPFQVLAHLGFTASFWIWTFINLIAFVLYLYFFLFKWTDRLQHRLVFMMALSFPFFFTLLEGQINIWLAIFIGEFLKAYLGNKPFRAGLWLGGLLWKPQTLILIIPLLLFKRAWKILGGFVISTIGILVVSVLLAGWNSLPALLRLWLNYAEGMPTNSPENMMNWRMLGVHLANINKPLLGWGIVGLGMIATLFLTYSLWRVLSHPLALDKQSSSEKLKCWEVLGTLAATFAFTWHSHLHMGMLLIPAIGYLYMLGELEERWLNIWLFLPPFTLILAFLLGVLLHNPTIMVAGQLGSFLLGLCGLFTNMLLLVVSFKRRKILTSII